jgi:hypothetical protein
MTLTYPNAGRGSSEASAHRSDNGDGTTGPAAPAEAPPAQGSPRVGPARGPGSTLRFQGEEMVIGRASVCDYVLNLPMVSGRHARVFRADDRTWLEDLGSLNGTYLNGQPVKRKTEVVSGDEIHLGTCDLVLCIGPQVEVETALESPVGSSPPPPRTGVVSLCLCALQRLMASLKMRGRTPAGKPSLTPSLSPWTEDGRWISLPRDFGFFLNSLSRNARASHVFKYRRCVATDNQDAPHGAPASEAPSQDVLRSAGTP